MSNQNQPVQLSPEDAFQLIVQYLRTGRHDRGDQGGSSYGYDVYLPNVMDLYIRETTVRGPGFYDNSAHYRTLSPVFYAAAWELCRRGILRPGVIAHGQQATDDGHAGNGYSLTPMGRTWLNEAGQYDLVPIEPARMARILANASHRFGPGYLERSQEAVRCYSALAYLACCAMCGASAEAILLALAIEKSEDESTVLKTYASSGGRGRIENMIIGQQPAAIQNELRGYTSLLKYWRDAAAHGRSSNITDNEAFTSLALLIRFANFASDQWNVLTQSGQ